MAPEARVAPWLRVSRSTEPVPLYPPWSSIGGRILLIVLPVAMLIRFFAGISPGFSYSPITRTILPAFPTSQEGAIRGRFEPLGAWSRPSRLARIGGLLRAPRHLLRIPWKRETDSMTSDANDRLEDQPEPQAEESKAADTEPQTSENGSERRQDPHRFPAESGCLSPEAQTGLGAGGRDEARGRGRLPRRPPRRLRRNRSRLKRSRLPPLLLSSRRPEAPEPAACCTGSHSGAGGPGSAAVACTGDYRVGACQALSSPQYPGEDSRPTWRKSLRLLWKASSWNH